MKKKLNLAKNTENTPRSHKNRNSFNTANLGLLKKRQESSNKQNIIQVTEPPYSNSISKPSKQLMRQKQTIYSNSKANYKEFNINGNVMPSQNSRQIISKCDKEQELIDRRLSLKCTVNNLLQDKQKSQRLSMAPLRREATIISCAYPPSLIEERQSLSSINQQFSIYGDSKLRHEIKKQAIITNFVNKLQHEQDLRTIIESKLRNNSSQLLLKDRKNKSYLTDFTQESSQSMVTKLRQCENQIKYFKSLIHQMSQKILDIKQQKKNNRTIEEDRDGPKKNNTNYTDLVKLVQKIGKQCSNCQKNQSRTTKQMSTQTVQNFQRQQNTCKKSNELFDFADHIEQTLKVLDYRKH